MIFPGFIVDQLPSAYPTAGHLSPYVPDLAGPDDSVNHAGTGRDRASGFAASFISYFDLKKSDRGVRG